MLLAANDDRNIEDPYPVLQKVSVTPGDTYWLQVDGSGGGTEGYFTIQVFDNNSTPAEKINGTTGFIAYPLPAKDMLYIRNSYPSDGKCRVDVYSAAGTIVFKADDLDPSSGEMKVPVGNLNAGLYFVKITGADYSSAVRFIKE